jgi:hypothetical protein
MKPNLALQCLPSASCRKNYIIEAFDSYLLFLSAFLKQIMTKRIMCISQKEGGSKLQKAVASIAWEAKHLSK